MDWRTRGILVVNVHYYGEGLVLLIWCLSFQRMHFPYTFQNYSHKTDSLLPSLTEAVELWNSIRLHGIACFMILKHFQDSF